MNLKWHHPWYFLHSQLIGSAAKWRCRLASTDFDWLPILATAVWATWLTLRSSTMSDALNWFQDGHAMGERCREVWSWILLGPQDHAFASLDIVGIYFHPDSHACFFVVHNAVSMMCVAFACPGLIEKLNCFSVSLKNYLCFFTVVVHVVQVVTARPHEAVWCRMRLL